jgi:hypothetical protein
MTLPLDVVTHIRRLHFAEHWKVGTIATELRVHHEAVEPPLPTCVRIRSRLQLL